MYQNRISTAIHNSSLKSILLLIVLRRCIFEYRPFPLVFHLDIHAHETCWKLLIVDGVRRRVAKSESQLPMPED